LDDSVAQAVAKSTSVDAPAVNESMNASGHEEAVPEDMGNAPPITYLEDMKADFASMDENKDGKLDEAELMKALRGISSGSDKDEDDDDEQWASEVKASFNAADADRDGGLKLEEAGDFLALVNHDFDLEDGEEDDEEEGDQEEDDDDSEEEDGYEATDGDGDDHAVAEDEAAPPTA